MFACVWVFICICICMYLYVYVSVYAYVKIRVPQSPVLHTKRQGLGALLHTSILRNPHMYVYVHIHVYDIVYMCIIVPQSSFVGTYRLGSGLKRYWKIHSCITCFEQVSWALEGEVIQLIQYDIELQFSRIGFSTSWFSRIGFSECFWFNQKFFGRTKIFGL